MLTPSKEPPTLLQALKHLYVEKRLRSDLGEFSRIILIHGLFRRHWEVEAYFGQALSKWEPTAQRQSSTDLKIDLPIWLPSIPTFRKWRNSTCDSLDILHWDANAKIGIASGIEHPTVMHLHLSRIILLTPYKEIVDLTRVLVDDAAAHLTQHAGLNEQKIKKWAVQDQYKARLAMVHAGVTWWHARCYSSNAFYEGPSVALATLALWAFSTFTSKTTPEGNAESAGGPVSNPEEPAQHSSESAGQARSLELQAPKCDIILLDRPTDDELVQQYITEGHRMNAHVSGVGNILDKRAPELILIAGRTVLDSLTCWAVRHEWLHLIDQLILVTRQRLENTS